MQVSDQQLLLMATVLQWKTGEKRGRPESIRHVSRYKVDMGGGLIHKHVHVRTKLEGEFLTGQDEYFRSC